MITVEFLNQTFNYIKDIGYLSWRKPLSNRVHTGKLITANHSHGYCKVAINKHRYYVHHIIWFLEYKVWPTKIIDHINGDPSDNRIENLREVTHSENLRNTNRFRNGESGVHYSKRDKKWACHLRINKHRHIIGSTFSTKKEALKARDNFLSSINCPLFRQQKVIESTDEFIQSAKEEING